MGVKKRKILQILSRRWLRSQYNGLCILTFITIFLYMIYFTCFYYVFIKKNVENESENESGDVEFVNDVTRYFPVNFSSTTEKASFDLADRDMIRKYLNTILKDNLKLEKGSICQPATLEQIEEEHNKPKIVCSSSDWVKCYKTECKIVKELSDITENITCQYRDVHYWVDGGFKYGKWTPVPNNSTYVLKESDYVTIKCTGLSSYGLFPTTWQGQGVGIRKQNKIKDKMKHNVSVNILLLGFGCGTRTEFMKKLPKTYKILTKTLNATVLNGFTSLGEQFTSQIFPILTGKHELEFSDVRKKIVKFRMQSGWLIFRTLEKFGYRTAFFEDSPTIFSRLNEFYSWPAQHFNRPFLKHLYSKKEKLCLGDSSLYEIFMNLTQQFLDTSEKSFAFTLISSACGQYAADVDNAALKLLDSLDRNTMVIVFGTRGGGQKRTNSDPPFAAIIPHLKSHPDVQTSLQGNTNAVTTPYDIYATLLDAVNLTEYWSKNKVERSKFFRGLSILREIPSNRTCSDAAVLPEWCSCHIYDDVTRADSLYMTLAHAFVNYINMLTAPVRKRCSPHHLYAINWMKRKRVIMKSITYDGSVDRDGYVSRFNTRKRNPEELYKMQLVMSPSGATFEATAIYYNKNGKIVFEENKIIRIDDNKTYCILPTHPELIKYCFCK